VFVCCACRLSLDKCPLTPIHLFVTDPTLFSTVHRITKWATECAYPFLTPVENKFWTYFLEMCEWFESNQRWFDPIRIRTKKVRIWNIRRIESSSVWIRIVPTKPSFALFVTWSLQTGGETRICTLILCDSVKTLIATKVHKVGFFGIGEVCQDCTETIFWMWSPRSSKSNVNLKVALATDVTRILRARDHGYLWRHALFLSANRRQVLRRSNYFWWKIQCVGTKLQNRFRNICSKLWRLYFCGFNLCDLKIELHMCREYPDWGGLCAHIRKIPYSKKMFAKQQKLYANII